MSEMARSAPTHEILAARLVTAALQGLALYALNQAASGQNSWAATHRALFEPMVLIAFYIPILYQLGLGQIAVAPLGVWALAASIFLAALGYHDAARGTVPATIRYVDFWPRWELWVSLTAALFVAHTLVVDSVIERRWMPRYSRHFDTAWKQGVQAALALAFTGVFWGMLGLGAALFSLVHLEGFRRLIQHGWFAWPATTLALAVSIHVTDVEPALIRGVRTLALTLFSWLLPVLAAILAMFLGVLPLISLSALWNTHFATRLLLTAAACMVVLINSAYQDGAAGATANRIKRLAATLGGLEIAPLAALAASALSQRVAQYGWSVERILAAASSAVIGCYAIGYALAVARRRPWLQPLETTNLVAAYVFLAIFLALFSPVADPSRLMVASQMARLTAGAVTPDQFDFVSMRFDGAKWGTAALAALAQGNGTLAQEMIAKHAAKALAAQNRFEIAAPYRPPPMPPADVASRFVIVPAGHKVPDGLLTSDFWQQALGHMPDCLIPPLRYPGVPGGDGAGFVCTLRFQVLQAGAPESILLFEQWRGEVLQAHTNGQWQVVASFQDIRRCAGQHDPAPVGDVTLAPHGWPDIVSGKDIYVITPRAACQ